MSLDVSRMLDGDLAGDELKTTLATLDSDADQRDRYTLYGLVGDVLRGNSTPDDGFSMRIFRRMGAEGTQIDPEYDPLPESQR
jgi:negative regulator of sigma E activity